MVEALHGSLARMSRSGRAVLTVVVPAPVMPPPVLVSLPPPAPAPLDVAPVAERAVRAEFGSFVDLGADPLGDWDQAAAVTRNTMFGIGAGARLDRTFLGWNTFFGHQAGNAMVGNAHSTLDSSENTFIGCMSGANQPSGSFNTYVGNVTGWGCNYDSNNNTYLGMDVFRGSPEFGLFNAGSNNTGVGARVMRNGLFDQCCTLGAFTMQYQNTTSTQVSIHNSIAIGFGAMTGDPTATGSINNCTVVGWFAGASLGMGGAPASVVQGNVLVGTAAGRYNKTGNYNTLIGYNSGANPGFAVAFTTCVGANTGVALTTGNQLTAMGFNAASKVTTGNANTFFGYQSGLNVSTGSFNHFFGNSTGGAVTTGNRNTLIGHLAGSTNLVTGSDNIIVGYGLDTLAAATGSTINIGNTFMATVAGGPTSNARIELAGLSVGFFNSLMTATALGVSIDVPNQLVTAITVASAGSGYLVNDSLHDASGGRYLVASVSGTGVATLTIAKPGISNTPPANPVTLTNGSKTTSSNQTGSGATANLTWGAPKALQLNKSAGDVLVSSGGLSNAAIDGFLGLPACNGVPTGTPTNAAQGPMLVFNKGSGTLNVYNGSSWSHLTLTAGAA